MIDAVRIIVVPYDSGRRAERMGAGPLQLLEAGLEHGLSDAGFHATTTTVELPPRTWPSEATSAFRLADAVGHEVRAAVAAGAFPLILSGNCLPAAFGAIAGLSSEQKRVVWFDAHGDFNTPDTSPSGFVDGTALAALCGRCWQAATRQVHGFAPVDERRVLLMGARDLDPGEAALLAASRVRRDALPESAEDIPIYVHLDLDVLDPAVAKVNQYAAPDGYSIARLQDALRMIGRSGKVAALSITAYDPSFDGDGALAAMIVNLVPNLLNAIQT